MKQVIVISERFADGLEQSVNESLKQLSQENAEVLDIKLSSSVTGDGTNDSISIESHTALIIYKPR